MISILKSSFTAALLLAASGLAQAGFWSKPVPEQQQFLPVDEAFELYPALLQDGQLELQWRIAPAHYLYQFRLRVEIVEPADAELAPVPWPSGLPYHDEHFGDVQIYRDALRVQIPAGQAAPTRLKVHYQGCADAGLCYPPQQRIVEVEAL